MDKEDIILEIAKGNIEFSDLDEKTKNDLIQTLCNRFLNVEG